MTGYDILYNDMRKAIKVDYVFAIRQVGSVLQLIFLPQCYLAYCTLLFMLAQRANGYWNLAYKTARPVIFCSNTRKTCTWIVNAQTNVYWGEET